MKPSPYKHVTIQTPYYMNTYTPVSLKDVKVLLRAFDLKAKKILKDAEDSHKWKGTTLLYIDLTKLPDSYKKNPKEVASGSGAASSSAGSSRKTRKRESFTWGCGYR